MPERLLIDGYNLIHASGELAALMREDPEAAREKLLSDVEEYCAREGRTAEVVFDAGGRQGPASHEELSEFLSVTYTAGGQSADAYIERLAFRAGAGASETLLVTGDYDQQKIAAGAGMLRMSSREFVREMEESRRRSAEASRQQPRRPWRVTLGRRLSDETRAALERFKKHQ